MELHGASRPLRRSDLALDPLEQFRNWFAEAQANVDLPEAMVLATAAPNGRPSARMVLLKSADEGGFRFFSSYESRKGRELSVNPVAALLFYWQPLGRQIRIEGAVAQLPSAASDAYFASRPAASRASAAASPQSRVVESRDDLERRAAAAGEATVRPEWWGGYVLIPETYEFWQHGEHRLHDRFRYRRDDIAWVVERLAP